MRFPTRLRQLTQRLRLALIRRLKGDYAARLAQELAIFEGQFDVNALPAIFHYWSNTYLRPMLEAYGYANPDQFFAHYLGRAITADSRSERAIHSLGAGNCDTEVRVAALLREAGHTHFRIVCLDANPAMLERGRQLAASEGLADYVIPTQVDLNRWKPAQPATAVMANQSLHHFLELETIFDAVKQALLPGAPFVISDMIGRNGHQRWPEAMVHVQQFWQELPQPYRYNVQLYRKEKAFKDWDCSVAGFEGIRAQDILPLLLERFHFHTFIGFANLVDPFIDRSFGHHFNAEAEWDRDFIDRIHALDESLLQAGEITPTHMMAVVSNIPCSGVTQFSRGLDPAHCVRDPAIARGPGAHNILRRTSVADH